MSKDRLELDDIFRKEAFDHYSNGLDATDDQAPTLKKSQLNIALLLWIVLIVALVAILNYPLKYQSQVTGQVMVDADSWYVQIPVEKAQHGATATLLTENGEVKNNAGAIDHQGKLLLDDAALKAAGLVPGQKLAVGLEVRKSILEEFLR